ncbi:Rare lipoprotein B family [gamma proteobacterium HTCC5015]|nr:Rare lipoprotein B family [gamma proteobacterium HTCC5015]
MKTIRRHIALYGVAIVAICALSACGFQLRGNYDLPPALSAVQLESSQPYGDVMRHLRRYLAGAGVRLGDSDGARVQVGAVRNSRRVVSVDSLGRPREYSLASEVVLSVPETPSGYALAATTLRVERDYFFDPEGVLSAGEQERQLREDMAKDLALRIMYRLQSSR